PLDNFSARSPDPVKRSAEIARIPQSSSDSAPSASASSTSNGVLGTEYTRPVIASPSFANTSTTEPSTNTRRVTGSLAPTAPPPRSGAASSSRPRPPAPSPPHPLSLCGGVCDISPKAPPFSPPKPPPKRRPRPNPPPPPPPPPPDPPPPPMSSQSSGPPPAPL